MPPKRVRSTNNKEEEPFKPDEISSGFTIAAASKPHHTFFKYILFHSKAKSAIGRYLSNFQPARVRWNGHDYPSVEHAFQSAKFLFSERKLHALDLASDRPGGKWPAAVAKKYGSRKSYATLGLTLKDEWNTTASHVMRELIRSRARYDSLFRKILRKAKQEGVALLHHERSGRKAIWGGAFDKTRKVFEGGNRLGMIMMSVSK